MDILPGYIKQSSLIIYFAMLTIITALPVPPFLYRYLVVCHNAKVSTCQIFGIYLIFAAPTLIFIPFGIYLGVKYDDSSMNLTPNYCVNSISQNLNKLDPNNNVTNRQIIISNSAFLDRSQYKFFFDVFSFAQHVVLSHHIATRLQDTPIST
jgi:hypothetical protein